MSSLEVHKSQATHNEELANKLFKSESSKYKDWSCVTAFYSALHFVEAKLNTMPKYGHTEKHLRESRVKVGSELQTTLHAWREKIIDAEFPKIRRQYAQLMSASKSTRYLELTENKSAFDWMTNSLAARLLADLKFIKKELET